MRSALGVMGLAFVVWLAWKTRSDVAQALAILDLWLVLLALAFGLALTSCYGFIFSDLAARNGIDEPPKRLFGAYLFSQLAKYIPGKVWPTIVQSTVLGPKAGLISTGLVNIEISLLATIHVAVLALFCLTLLMDGAVTATSVLLLGAIFSTVVARLDLRTLGKFLAARLERHRNSRNSEPCESQPSGFGRRFASQTGCLVANLAATFLLLLAIGDWLPYGSILPIAASLLLATLLSLVAIVFPAGIGIRELATISLGAMIVPELPSSTMATVALVLRVWQTATDCLAFTVGAALIGGREKDF